MNTWKQYVERDNTATLYYCSTCRRTDAMMFYKHVRNSEDDEHTHKEYRIECKGCHKHGSTHWSKNIAEFAWKSENEKT